ncbi:hypothetical protein PHMEG_00012441 [Phytophthora megakarya]|uniref:MULE transposase domain-containing protein n=1 Tax=Phytophthora megakarya TaxID=4795 RepID=A0A225W959_9STRA|nr:hypothetical protein PHMEG_00012441 [Phytophthora megakarya]
MQTLTRAIYKSRSSLCETLDVLVKSVQVNPASAANPWSKRLFPEQSNGDKEDDEEMSEGPSSIYRFLQSAYSTEQIAELRQTCEMRYGFPDHLRKPTATESTIKHRQMDMTQSLRDPIEADAQTGVSASQSLARIVAANPDISLKSQDIYNQHHKCFESNLEGISRMQFLLNIFYTPNYFVSLRENTSNRISHEKGDFSFALQALKDILISENIFLPQVVLVNRGLTLLKALEDIFPEIPALLCVWHVVKDVEAHANRSIPKIIDLEKSNRVTHLGLQATSRVGGYHAALKRWLRSSHGDMLTAFTRMQHWWNLENRKYYDRLYNAQIKSLASLRNPIFHGVTTIIHNYALKKCLDQLDFINIRPCTGRFTQTTGIPCSHKLRNYQRSNTLLVPSDFHAHWWVDRQSATVPPPFDFGASNYSRIEGSATSKV